MQHSTSVETSTVESGQIADIASVLTTPDGRIKYLRSIGWADSEIFRLRPTRDAAEAATRAGFPIAVSTINGARCRRNGPTESLKIGGRTLYALPDLIGWLVNRSRAPQREAAESAPSMNDNDACDLTMSKLRDRALEVEIPTSRKALSE